MSKKVLFLFCGGWLLIVFVLCCLILRKATDLSPNKRSWPRFVKQLNSKNQWMKNIELERKIRNSAELQRYYVILRSS